MKNQNELDELINQLDIENKIKEGAENLLQVFDQRTEDREDENHIALRKKIELELDTANLKIEELKAKVNIIKSKTQTDSIKSNTKTINTFYEQDGKSSVLPYTVSSKSVHSSVSIGEKDEQIETIDPIQSLQAIFRSLDESINDSGQYLKHANHLVSLIKSHPTLKQDLNWEALSHHFQIMFSSSDTNKVSSGYRIARFVIYDLESISFIKKFHVEHAIIRSLIKDNSTSKEREQALKLIRTFYGIKDGISEISKSVVSAIVSLAEYTKDKMSLISIETLAEMFILDPALIVSAGGNKVLLQTLSDGPFEIANEIAKLFIYLLDTPATRKFIRPKSDLQLILSNVTNFRPIIEEYRLKYCGDGIVSIMKSWSGLVYMSMYDMQAIRSLVDVLRISSSRTQDIVLDILYNLFGIKSSSITSAFLAGRRLTTWGRPSPSQQEPQNEGMFTNTFTEFGRNNLLQQFLALTIMIFMDIGILDALMAAAENSKDKIIFRKTTLLIVELLHLSNRILPLQYGAKLQSLPKLFISALEFSSEKHFIATSAILQIESLNRIKMKTNFVQQKERSTSLENPLKRGKRQLEQVKIKLGLQIDDIRFRTLLLDTQVLNTKNYKKWRWDIVIELLNGPLLNPKRLDESIRTTKFMKRLLSFYLPFNYKFSNIKQTRPNQRYIKIGRMIFTTLLANSEGIRYLSDSKLLRQISECLAQLDPLSGVSSPSPLFSKQRLEETLSSGYFVFLGTLSENKDGIAMMEKWKIFDMFYHLTELRSRDDLILNFIINMNYIFYGHPRIILSKALVAGLKDVRLFVTKHLGTLLSSNKKFAKNTKSTKWAISLLVTQLYDPCIEVCQMAVEVLEKACYDFENLQYTVKLRPALEHLGNIGAPLRLRFLASSTGFNYLKELDYIEKEMDNWFYEQNEIYVNYIENHLSLAFSFAKNNEFDGLIPPHFYGEIIKTSEGCQLLKNKGHFEYFVSNIFKHKDEYEDKNIILHLKSSLWAVGNIGSHNNGFPFLENSGVISEIIYIAEKSQVISLRGTAFFVLGLISITISVSQILEQHGWASVFTSFGIPIGICVPKDIKKILFLEPWNYCSCLSDLEENIKLVSKNIIQDEILKIITDLSSHIFVSKALKSLSRIKSKYPEEFKSLDLYKSVLKILASYRYQQPIRKFILEMFPSDIFYQNHELFD
ncbi:hypothetical protein T552_01525 [Pneumocystis carinii B80]|uniref:REM-1 domain-containing protein n=1 Tax=Pneumocystis carinii (strain B80) TaxID=1408658 RepID=A0A0W4ZKK1_PNEC8|nr:hypothetical protein T552_01525 [Pneumocystis carinii B80]KTW28896.1 hypothetical protein T552_01525 [Pneumocystis carinii B80]